MEKNPDSRVALPIHAIPGKELHENGYDENGPGVRDRTTEVTGSIQNVIPETVWRELQLLPFLRVTPSPSIWDA